MTVTEQRIRFLISISSKNLALSVAVLCLIGIVFIYGVVELVKIIKNYYEMKKYDKRQDDAVAATTPFGHKHKEDNETYEKRLKSQEDASELDEYQVFTRNIQQSIDSYKTYNEKVNNFYRNVRGMDDSPDLVDRSIFSAENDSY